MKILQVCAYAAPYEGNFMNSLYALQREVEHHGHEMIYVFPESAKNIDWCIRLAKNNIVYFLPLKKARIRLKTYHLLKNIFCKHKDIGIVHSHFELYDLPIALSTPKNVKIFWHLHNALTKNSFSRELLKKLQYKYLSRRANLISVAEVYRKELISLGFPQNQTQTIINGIDLNRIEYSDDIDDKEYDFLAMVWSFDVKGCDLIIKACKMLIEEGYSFKILLIGTDETRKYVADLFPNGTDAIVVEGSHSNVSELYRSAKTFISASRKETFSYAVCEAAYAGLPIISSRIPGLLWANCIPTICFFESENLFELYKCMKDYLNGKTASISEIESARRMISESYSAETWAKKIYIAYEDTTI